MIALAWLACAPGLPDVRVDARADGVAVTADAPIARIAVTDREGAVLVSRRWPAPAREVWVPVDAAVAGEAARLTVWTDGGLESQHVVEFPPPEPCALWLGEGGGERWPAGADRGESRLRSPLHVRWEAKRPSPVALSCGAAVSERVDDRDAEVTWTIAAPTPTRCEATCGGATWSWTLVPTTSPAVRIAEAAFPTDASGATDLSRSPGVVRLASPAWEAARRTLGFGVRSPDARAPWAWRAVTVANGDDTPVDLVVSNAVLDTSGAEAPAFRPRLRESDGRLAEVRALVRVPARGEARVTLPVYVDPQIAQDGRYIARASVLDLGGGELVVGEDALFVSRGSGAASIGLALAATLALLGGGMLALGGGSFVRASRTSELTIISLFATLQLVWGVGSQLFASAVTTLLGPFAPLLTGWVDEAIRAALLSITLTLVPRRGTLAATLVVAYLLRLLAFGSASVVDLWWMLAAVGAYEAAAVAFGAVPRVRRGEGTWALMAALTAASVLTAAAAMAVHVAVFRLFYADWYVAMVLIGPSGLYVAAGVALARPVVAALRQVQP